MQETAELTGLAATKICGVCGDRAKSYHFGGLSCDSCKAFFRRSVHKDAYKKFTCLYNGQCVINLKTRKSCQSCRMRRCFAIGMEKSWVMTDQERLDMMQARAQKKLQKEQQLQKVQQQDNTKPSVETAQAKYEPDIAKIGLHLKPEELDEIEGIILKYMKAYQQIPYDDALKYCNESRPGVQIINMFTTLIRRLAFFVRFLPQFAGLIHRDQSILLRGGILEMCLLRGALVFDPTRNRWPDTSYALYHDAPVLRLEDAGKLVSSKLFEMHMDFIACVQRMNVDEPTIMLLLMVVLFTPERPGITQTDLVTKHQEHFSELLRRYMGWRFGPVDSVKLFSKLLTKIGDLRELSDSHNSSHLRLAKQEVDEIQQQLGSLNLNPYPEWNVTVNPQLGEQNSFHYFEPKEHSFAHSQSNHHNSLPSPEIESDFNFGMEIMSAMQRSLTEILSIPNFYCGLTDPTIEMGTYLTSNSHITDDPYEGINQLAGSDGSYTYDSSAPNSNETPNTNSPGKDDLHDILEEFLNNDS